MAAPAAGPPELQLPLKRLFEPAIVGFYGDDGELYVREISEFLHWMEEYESVSPELSVMSEG